VGDLSPNFSRQEFACKCGCGVDAVDPILVMQLERMRASAGVPLSIRSGCRCQNHNREEGGKDDSAHLSIPPPVPSPAAGGGVGGGEPCQAVDLVAGAGAERFRLLGAAYEAGFVRMGIGRDFLHVDVDPDKPQRVIWLY